MTTRLIRLIGLAALALGFISILAPQAQADGFPYRRNHAFESEISSQKPMCLPPVDKRPEAEFDEKMAEFMRESGEYGWWALRLGYHGASECLAQNLIDPGQWIKYGSLYVAFLLSPTLVSTYAGGELTTDAAKCVAKAFVENSDTLDREQKDLFRSGIDTAASIKDAFSWVENGYKAISPVAKREKIRKLSTLKKLYDILDTARDRGEDLQGLIAFAAQEVEDADRYLQYVFGYGSDRAYLNAEDAYRACRYDDAEALLDKSRAAAEQECKVRGAQYRAFERDIRIYINNNYIHLQVGRKYAGENPQERTLKGLYDTFKIRKDALRKSLRSFAKADKLSQDIARARPDFEDLTTRYEVQQSRALQAFQTNSACDEIERLAGIAEEVPADCRDELLSGGGRKLSSLADLYRDLTNLTRHQSQDWNNSLDAARQRTEACDLQAAADALRTLKSDVLNRPVFAHINNQCRKVDQTPLLERIRALETDLEAYADGGTVTVPDLEGVPLQKAKRMLVERRLVVGPATLGAPAPANMEPGSVEGLSVAKGARVDVCTKVALSVYGPHRAVLQSTTPDADATTGEEAACIPADQVKRVCWSRDGRHEMCRAANCSIPEITKKTCVSGDGRDKMCQDNGCSPNFTNPDGSTFTVACKWIDEVVQAEVACYWEAAVPSGREICDEDAPDAEPQAASLGDSPRGQEGWVGRWDCSGRVGAPLNSDMHAKFAIVADAGRLFAIGVDEDIGEGRFPADLDGNRIRFTTPTVATRGANWDLTREGASSSGTISFVSPYGSSTATVGCARK